MTLAKPDSCRQCWGWSWGHGGYVPADGSGRNGVLIILEAAGAEEAATGLPTVGRAGYMLWNTLKRIDLYRDDFRIHNVLSCQPPFNKLAKQPYEDSVISSCSPLLDATIADMQEKCKATGKYFTILTLGRIAFKRVMGLHEKDVILRNDYLCYPFWSDKYKAFVLAGQHPSYLMRGNNHLIPILQFVTQRAVEIAEHGLTFDEPTYLLDPDPATFAQWVTDFKLAYEKDQSLILFYDIETPHKQGKDEEEVAREDDEDYEILRCSFAYKAGEAVSIPWRAEYVPILEDLFSHQGDKGGWNLGYDYPRVTAKMPVNGAQVDGMLAWHVLNSALPKGLGPVTPYYVKNTGMWKHLSDKEPAFYNAKDSDMSLRNYLGIKADLIKNNQWRVFERHVIQLNKVLTYMSSKGVLRDEVMRQGAEVRVAALLNDVEKAMDAAVPQGARRLSPKNGYKKTPSSTEGLVLSTFKATVKRCDRCGTIGPTKTHFKARKKSVNPCEGAGVVESIEEVERWAKVLEFKVSKVGLSNYQKVLHHQAIIDRRENKTTFDETALKQLIKKYPHDKLYPLILKQREYVKLISTYIGVTQENGLVRGGMPVGRDGKIHCQYTHNPSTLRLACQQPNMTNLPRAKQEEDLQTIVRNLIIASKGHILVELDFSAIEACLVGFFAGSADYIRLSKLGIHSYLASHVLGRPADLKWSDKDLKEYFKEIKKSKDQAVQDVYNASKRVTHLSGYGGTPKKMQIAEPEAFPTVKDAERLQGIYFDLCPYIRKWHLQVQLQADKDGFLRNPFSYVHRFSSVFKYTKEAGKWIRHPGDDANRVLAFLPQSTAAGIIKEAMLRLWLERFEEAGQYLRLQVHDSLVSEVPDTLVEQVEAVMKEEMTKPIPELRLPKSYGLGDYLTIDVESKKGPRWGRLV